MSSNRGLQVTDPDARIDELSPLVFNPPPAETTVAPSQVQKKVIRLLYVIIFLAMFGQYMQQPGARTQVYEDIVCRKYYDKLHERLVVGNGTSEEYDCKVRPVQEELALLKGWERFGDLFPTLLTIPYGVLADRYGRRIILFSALFGLLISECYTLTIAWFSAIFPIRLIWLQFVFQLIGGGSAVGNTMLNVIATDVTPAGMRTTVFFRTHGTAMATAIVAPTVGSLIMKYNAFLAWFLAEILLIMALLLVLLLPKALGKQKSTLSPPPGSEVGDEDAVNGSKPDTSVRGKLRDAFETLKPVFRVIAANRQLLLLFAMGLFAQIGNESLILILLMVISNRFGWSFARTNYLFSVSAVIQFSLLIAVLPLASHMLSQRLHLSALRKDRQLVLASSVIPALGAFCIAFAPKVGLAIFGVVLMSAGAGLTALVRSLISETTAPRNISVVFSVMTILIIAGGAFGGPIYSETYSAGVRLGPAWVGLPFVVAGAMLVVVFSMAVFMREQTQAQYAVVSEHEEES